MRKQSKYRGIMSTPDVSSDDVAVYRHVPPQLPRPHGEIPSGCSTYSIQVRVGAVALGPPAAAVGPWRGFKHLGIVF